MNPKRWFYATACISMISLMGALSGCDQAPSDTASQNHAPSATNSENPANENVLRIATEGAYAPFNYTNPDGSLGGFDVDIANALCQQMRKKCDIVAQDWDGIISGLKTDKYDAIIAAMSVTPERQEQVDFTQAYFDNSLVFLAKKESSFNPEKHSDMDTSTIAAQRSTISAQWLESHYPKANLKLYDTLNNVFLDLGADRANVAISDKLPAIQWLKSPVGKNYQIKGKEIDIDDHFAIAVRKGDPLREALDNALTAIKNDGTYEKISQQYFSAE